MKKFLHILVLSSVALFFNGCISGWGWLVPYNLQPSYHKFKKMCKLNELPNNEEKYNKILGYFDLSLDTLDWEELNKKTWKISEDNGNYRKGVFEYRITLKGKEINSRLGIEGALLSNEPKINRHNINAMGILATWQTRRYYLDGNEGSGFYWNEEELWCRKVITNNMIPKGANNEK